LVQDEFSLWFDRSEEAKLAVRDTLGEVFSDPVSLLEVVWFEPRDSTDQEDRSNDLHRHIFRITSFVINTNTAVLQGRTIIRIWITQLNINRRIGTPKTTQGMGRRRLKHGKSDTVVVIINI
jgi:hypothetical protein